MKFEGSGSKGTFELELLSRNGFHSSGRCDLDLWPTDPEINRGLLLSKGYHPMKFEGFGSKGTRVIERKRISLFGSLWHWPLTYWPQTSLVVFYSIRAITLCSLKALGQRVLELLSGNEVWQTDGQTDRRTSQKQYVSPRGGGDIL